MKNTANSSLKVVSLGQLLAHPFPPRHYLLTPWLRQGESALVWAASGLGKTMLTLTMALAVAGGGGFLGWHNGTPRRVLVVDGEMHAEDLKDRLAMLIHTVQGIDVAAASENLKLMPRNFQAAGADFPDIADRKGQDAVLKAAMEHRADLVILDNFSTLAEVEDENEASSMNPVLAFLLRLKQAGVATILVHHSGKNGRTYRGSSKLEATFEVILGLMRDEDAVASDGTRFETVWTKFRGLPDPSISPALVRLWTPVGHGASVWSAAPAESDMVRRMIAEAQTGHHTTQRELAKALDIAPGTLSKLKQRAERDGRLARGGLAELLDDAAGQKNADDPKAAF